MATSRNGRSIKRYPIGFFHIDIAEVQTAEGELYLFVGIDRTSTFAVTQLVEKADRRTAWEFLQHMLDLAPISPNTQAVAFWAAMNSRGERHFSPECGWFSL